MQKFLSKAIICFMIIFLGMATTSHFIVNLLFTIHNGFKGSFLDNEKFVNPLLYIVGIVIFVFLFYLFFRMTKKVATQRLRIISIFFAIFVSLFFCMVYYAPMQTSDVMVSSLGFFTRKTYLAQHPNNLALSFIYKLIYYAFGFGSFQIMYFINIFTCAIIVYILPKITRIITKSEKAERINILLLFLFYPLFALTTFLYNDFLGISSSLLALYFAFVFIENKKMKNIIFSAIFMSVAFFIRQNMVFFMIGIIFLLFYNLLQEKKQVLKNITIIILLPIVVLSFSFITSTIIYNAFDLPKDGAFPKTYWIAMSLQNRDSTKGHDYRAPGAYTRKINNIIKEKSPNMNKLSPKDKSDLYNSYSVEEIKTRLSEYAHNPLLALKTFAQKLTYTYGDSVFEANSRLQYNLNLEKEYIENYQTAYENFSGLTDQKDKLYFNEDSTKSAAFANRVGTVIIKGKIANFIRYIVTKPFALLIYLGALLYIILYRKKLNKYELTICLIFLGAFTFHQFLWETRTRYILPAFILLIPLACYITSNAISKLDKCVSQIYNKCNWDKINKGERHGT